MRAIRVAVSGAAGRMGQAVCAAVEAEDDLELAGRADPQLGASLDEVLDQSEPDVVVDFTTPQTGYPNARLCLERDVHAVVGTTGITDDQLAKLRSLAGRSKAN